MTGQFLAEAYAGDGRLAVHLGEALTTSPRLALRWLRGQVARFADGLDPAPDTPWIRPYVLRPVPALPPIPDAPTELRTWAHDDTRQAEALQQLAAGHAFEFIAHDGTFYELRPATAITRSSSRHAAMRTVYDHGQ